MAKKERIAVIGAGMGGVTAALVLQRAGYECTVYEQAGALARVGAGINVGPNATRIFRQLGLESKMLQVGVQPRLKYSREWDTGRFLYTVQIPELHAKYGSTFLAFHRGALQDVLCSALEEGTIKFGKRLESLEQRGEDVLMGFSDGSSSTAQIVIGADGVHSRVHALLFSPTPADYYGLVAYRSLIPRSSLGDLQVDDNTKWWAPDRFVITYYTTEVRDELNLVTGSPEEWTAKDFQPKDATTDALLADFAGFHPDVQRVLKAVPSLTKWPMLERKPFSPWSKGSVVLMGDACHPTTPFMGQGAGMAFEDAVVLARCIQGMNDGDAPEAFARYERTRIERTSRIQRESHENQWTKHGMDSADWLYWYDAFTAEIL